MLMMKIERVNYLSLASMKTCDFSFEIDGEMIPPYEDPFQQFK